jgi:hypothetical protein
MQKEGNPEPRKNWLQVAGAMLSGYQGLSSYVADQRTQKTRRRLASRDQGSSGALKIDRKTTLRDMRLVNGGLDLLIRN